MRPRLRSVAAAAMQRARARGLTIPRCVADRDEALALIREDHEQWERGSVKKVAIGSSESVPRLEP
jgi:hypothetical protein